MCPGLQAAPGGFLLTALAPWGGCCHPGIIHIVTCGRVGKTAQRHLVLVRIHRVRDSVREPASHKSGHRAPQSVIMHKAHHQPPNGVMPTGDPLTPRTEGRKSSQLRACMPCERRVRRRAVRSVRGMACGPHLVPARAVAIEDAEAVLSVVQPGEEA